MDWGFVEKSRDMLRGDADALARRSVRNAGEGGQRKGK